ncbi:hypothetical protein Tco_0216259 [Tanacetum coccineum]
MKDRICTLSKNDLKDLVNTYHILPDLYSRFPDVGFTMDRLLADAIGIYSEFLRFFGVRVPFSTFLLYVLKYFKVHISQLVPLGLNKVVSFEVVCRDLNIVPTVTLFRVFQCLCKQCDWFYFSKHRNTEDVCMDDGPSSLKKWKDKFFLIDRRAVQDYLTWRHSCSCVLDDFPSDGYDRIDDNAEMSIYDFMTLPSWSDAKIVEESHHLSFPLLERVPSHTTAPASGCYGEGSLPPSEGAIIPLPTPDEMVASLPDPRLAKKSKGPSLVSRSSKKRKLQKRASEAGSSTLELGQAEGVNEADLADLCAELEDSLERDEGVSTRAVLAPIPRLGKRLSAPPSTDVASISKPSHVGTSAPAPTSGRSLSLGGVVASGRTGKSGAQMDEVMHRQMDLLDCLARSALARDAEYDQIPDDDFGTAIVEWNEPYAPECNVLCEDIFKDPDVYRKALDQTITPAELRRTESLLPLEAHLQEKLDKKKGDVELLRSEVTSLDSKLENLQRDCDALGVALSEELTHTDAKLSEQALTIRDLQNELGIVRKLLSSDEFHAALARVTSLSIKYGVERGLRMGRTDVEFEEVVQKVSNFHVGAKADFDKALDDFPTTPFPFLSKIAAASEGSLSDVA